MAKMRVSVGCDSAKSKSSVTYGLLHTKPLAPWPIIRMPFWMASSKVRPMAITSPTLFMPGPMSRETPLNFARSQRGIFTTT